MAAASWKRLPESVDSKNRKRGRPWFVQFLQSVLWRNWTNVMAWRHFTITIIIFPTTHAKPANGAGDAAASEFIPSTLHYKFGSQMTNSQNDNISLSSTSISTKFEMYQKLSFKICSWISFLDPLSAKECLSPTFNNNKSISEGEARTSEGKARAAGATRYRTSLGFGIISVVTSQFHHFQGFAEFKQPQNWVNRYRFQMICLQTFLFASGDTVPRGQQCRWSRNRPTRTSK